MRVGYEPGIFIIKVLKIKILHEDSLHFAVCHAQLRSLFCEVLAMAHVPTQLRRQHIGDGRRRQRIDRGVELLGLQRLTALGAVHAHLFVFHRRAHAETVCAATKQSQMLCDIEFEIEALLLELAEEIVVDAHLLFSLSGLLRLLHRLEDQIASRDYRRRLIRRRRIRDLSA